MILYFLICSCTSLASYLVVRLHMLVRDFFLSTDAANPGRRTKTNASARAE